MSSRNRPCADPRICGVQTHRPGTQCKAEYLTRGARNSKGGMPVASAAPPSARTQEGPIEVDPDDVEGLIEQTGGDNEVYNSGNLFEKHTSAALRSDEEHRNAAPKSLGERNWEVTINRVQTEYGQMYLVQDNDPMAGEPDEDVAENMSLHDDESSARDEAEERVAQWQRNWEVDPEEVDDDWDDDDRGMKMMNPRVADAPPESPGIVHRIGGRNYTVTDMDTAAEYATRLTDDEEEKDMLISLTYTRLAADPQPGNDMDTGPSPEDGVDWSNAPFELEDGSTVGVDDIITKLSASQSRRSRAIAMTLQALKGTDSVYRSDARVVDPGDREVDDQDRDVIRRHRGLEGLERGAVSDYWG